MAYSSTTRRSVLKNAALGSVAAIAAPYVHGAYAAGSLSLGVWDHWVPGANNTLTKLCNEWGEKNKVEVKIDYITSQGEKDKLTAAAEAQAGRARPIDLGECDLGLGPIAPVIVRHTGSGQPRRIAQSHFIGEVGHEATVRAADGAPSLKVAAGKAAKRQVAQVEHVTGIGQVHLARFGGETG